MQENVFDIIETADKKYVGIVDFVSAKYVTFFSVDEVEDVDYRHLMLLYKTYYPNIRFSIFLALYARQFNFGDPILINKKLIKYHSRPLYTTKPFRAVSKITGEKEVS